MWHETEAEGEKKSLDLGQMIAASMGKQQMRVVCVKIWERKMH